MQNKEIISIIMPAYNSGDTIIESILSVINQTYIDWVLYIINDNSSDNTHELIVELASRERRIVYLINDSNRGVAYTRNRGINECKGKFIAFLDSDDLWLPTKLEEQYKFLSQGWLVVCSNYLTFNGNIEVTRVSPEIIYYRDLLKSNYIGNLTGIYNANKLGIFLQKNMGHEDYIMWLKIIEKSEKAYCVQKTLAKYRLSSTSLSGNKFKAIFWQWSIYRNELKFSIFKASYYFYHYVVNAIKKRR